MNAMIENNNTLINENLISEPAFNKSDIPADFVGYNIAYEYLKEFGDASGLSYIRACSLSEFKFADYPYDKLPVGVFAAHLDCKVWGKIRNLRCFLRLSSGIGISMSVFSGDYYRPPESAVQMNKTPPGTWMMIETAKRKRNDNIYWKNAVLID